MSRTNSSVESGVTTKKGQITKIWMTKDIRLSANYNSSCVSFGMESTVEGDLNAVKKKMSDRIDEELKKQMDSVIDFLNSAAK